MVSSPGQYSSITFFILSIFSSVSEVRTFNLSGLSISAIIFFEKSLFFILYSLLRDSLLGRAPIPYTVSVGKIATPPFFKISTISFILFFRLFTFLFLKRHFKQVTYWFTRSYSFYSFCKHFTC